MASLKVSSIKTKIISKILFFQRTLQYQLFFHLFSQEPSRLLLLLSFPIHYRFRFRFDDLSQESYEGVAALYTQYIIDDCILDNDSPLIIHSWRKKTQSEDEINRGGTIA